MTIFFSQVDEETLPLAAKDTMQSGHTLDLILRNIILVNPAYRPVLMSKCDISDGFYHIDLNVEDIPKLGVDFPTVSCVEPLVTFPLDSSPNGLEEQSTRILHGL